MADKKCEIVHGPWDYVATETEDLDYFATIPLLTRSKAQRDDLAAERRLRRCFAGFAEKRVDQGMLDGNKAEFQDRVKTFSIGLKSQLLGVHST